MLVDSGALIYGLLGGNAVGCGNRVYPVTRQQGSALPAVVYEEYDNNPSDTKSGRSDLDVVLVEITVLAKTYAEARDINRNIRDILDRYTGTVNGVTTDGVRFLSTQDMAMGTATDVYKVVSDYQVRLKV